MSWTVDAQALVALRLRRARDLLDQGDYDQALVEAEELLSASPHHTDALQVVGEAALGMGNAALACIALNQAATLAPTPGLDVLRSLAMALFECGEYALAHETAEAALAHAPEDAPSWYTRGLAAERLGRSDVAEAFARAAALDATRYPPSEPIPEARWQQALDAAKALLPAPLRTFYARVPITWGEFPALEALRATDPPLSPLSDALFEGEPPETDDPWEVVPDAVRLYRTNLARPPADDKDLAERVALALTQEALDWLGVPSLDALDAQSA